MTGAPVVSVNSSLKWKPYPVNAESSEDMSMVNELSSFLVIVANPEGMLLPIGVKVAETVFAHVFGVTTHAET